MTQLARIQAEGADTGQAELGGPHERTDLRNNLFVVATLCSDQGSGPIRIRNLSCMGALIDGGVLPGEGSRVRVSRGSLAATGRIIWRRDHRAGIRFECAIRVHDWLPGCPRTDSPSRIDARPPGHQPQNEFAPPNPDLSMELIAIHRTLGNVAERLLCDPAILDRHSADLVTIDMAAAKLEKLARRVSPKT